MIFDEKNIIYRAQQCDSAAFSQLVEAYQGSVYRIALRMGLSPSDAEDAAQEAFVKAWRALPTFRGDSRFSTWLYRLTANAAVDVQRREKRQKEADDIDEVVLPDESASPQQQVEKTETQAAVRNALAQLPEEYRTVLLLRYMEDLSYEEIGRALKLPPAR